MDSGVFNLCVASSSHAVLFTVLVNGSRFGHGDCVTWLLCTFDTLPSLLLFIVVFLNTFFFFFLTSLWSIIALQWCASFCFITKWISYTYTYTPISPPSCVSLPPTLSHPSRWSQSTLALCVAPGSSPVRSQPFLQGEMVLLMKEITNKDLDAGSCWLWG